MSVQPQQRQATSGPESLFGTWGTEVQCAAHAADNMQDQRLFPLIISNEWIQQGWIYCYLQWRGHNTDSNNIQAFALAQCGEDTIRDYQLEFNLETSELKIQWSKNFTTDPLQRCE